MQQLALLFKDRRSFAHEPVRLIVMVSGGHDSTALLWILVRVAAAIRGSLKSKWQAKFTFDAPTFEVCALHCNHKTRGFENDFEQNHITDLCLHWGVHFRAVCKDDWESGANFQDEARLWRMAEAKKWAVSLGQHYFICTAHHARDVVETVLLQLCRGTGVLGLLSLSEVCEKQQILRPLVNTCYDDLKSYSSSQNLVWVEDSSNEKTDYARNKIRHEVLPCLAQLNPSYEKAFLTMQKNLRSELK
jgi:tRNA(Ile)-lysidine synthase